MEENHIKTELDYELKRFNKEKEVKKLNEKFENEIAMLSLDPFSAAGDMTVAPLPNPAIIDVQLEHRKALAAYAQVNGFHLVYDHLTKEEA